MYSMCVCVLSVCHLHVYLCIRGERGGEGRGGRGEERRGGRELEGGERGGREREGREGHKRIRN